MQVESEKVDPENEDTRDDLYAGRLKNLNQSESIHVNIVQEKDDASKKQDDPVVVPGGLNIPPFISSNAATSEKTKNTQPRVQVLSENLFSRPADTKTKHGSNKAQIITILLVVVTIIALGALVWIFLGYSKTPVV